MPNKTIYVSDADLPLFTRAVELTGGNLSAAIVVSLRRLVEVEEAKLAGFEEVTVKVGVGAVERIQRFVAVRLAEWQRTTKEGRVETFCIYRGRSGKFVLQTLRRLRPHGGSGRQTHRLAQALLLRAAVRRVARDIHSRGL